MSDEFKKLYTKSLNRLSRKDYSTSQMVEFLQRYSENSKLIHEVIDKLKESNFIDDNRLIKEIIVSLRSKGYGSFRIEKKLEQVGFEKRDYQIYIQEEKENDPIELQEQLKQVQQQSYTGSKLQVTKKIQEKLIRKGFPVSQVFSFVTSDIIDYDESESCLRDCQKLRKQNHDRQTIINKLYQKGYFKESIQNSLEKSENK